MKRLGLPILLIFMMLITPIASAFEHCAGAGMSDHLSEFQNFSATQPANNAIQLDHKKTFKGSQNNQSDMDCHNSDSCTIHICGGFGIISSIPVINIITSHIYSFHEYVSPYNTTLSPDLRPPKFIL